MDTLLLNIADLKKLITMRDVIEIVDKTFADLAAGNTLNPTKVNLNLGDTPPTKLPYNASLNAMPAYIGWQDNAGQKWAGGWNRGRKLIGRPFINALIMLVDPDFGDFKAVMDGAWITNMRTGAQTAVIARYMLKDKKDITVGIYGAGVQGHTQTEALTAIFNVTKLYVYDPVRAAAEKFKEDMKDKVQGEIIICDAMDEPARNAEIVISVTCAKNGFLKGEWLKKGSIYFAMGSYQECDEQAILGADKIVVDHVGQCLHRGNLKNLADAGRLTEKDIFCTAGELALGQKDVGDLKDQRILAIPIGMGCLDVAVAGIAYKKAVSRSMGEYFSFDEGEQD